MEALGVDGCRPLQNVFSQSITNPRSSITQKGKPWLARNSRLRRQFALSISWKPPSAPCRLVTGSPSFWRLEVPSSSFLQRASGRQSFGCQRCSLPGTRRRLVVRAVLKTMRRPRPTVTASAVADPHHPNAVRHRCHLTCFGIPQTLLTATQPAHFARHPSAIHT